MENKELICPVKRIEPPIQIEKDPIIDIGVDVNDSEKITVKMDINTHKIIKRIFNNIFDKFNRGGKI